jgi:hypothetical protein
MGFDIIRIIENNLVLLIALIVFFVILRKKSIKKAEFGPLKIENQTDSDKFEVIDPHDSCPYDKAYTATRNAIREVASEVADLEKDIKYGFQMLTEKHELEAIGRKKTDVNLLKLMLNTSSVPPQDRVLAGLECVFMGENGWTKKDAIGISEKYLDIYKAICAARPELRLPEVEESCCLNSKKP